MALNTFKRNYLTPMHFKGLMSKVKLSLVWLLICSAY